MKPEDAVALRRPFPQESVGSLPKGGVMLDYVGHAAVTDRLLSVDPEWSWDFAECDPATGQPSLRYSLDPDKNLWIRLTICGVTRIGVGDGPNAKEKIGDALRNAAMRFGVGLDLWAKENLVEFAQAHVTATRQAEQQAPEGFPDAPPRPPDEPLIPAATDKPITTRTRGQMFALFAQKGVEEAQQLAGINHITGKAYTSRSELTEADAKEVIRVLKTRPDVQQEEAS